MRLSWKTFLLLIQFIHDAQGKHFFGKIPFVKGSFIDRFVQAVQLLQRELWREQLEADGVARNFLFQQFFGLGDHFFMIEDQGRYFI
jgi:hypothetical protein